PEEAPPRDSKSTKGRSAHAQHETARFVSLVVYPARLRFFPHQKLLLGWHRLRVSDRRREGLDVRTVQSESHSLQLLWVSPLPVRSCGNGTSGALPVVRLQHALQHRYRIRALFDADVFAPQHLLQRLPDPLVRVLSHVVEVLNGCQRLRAKR